MTQEYSAGAAGGSAGPAARRRPLGWRQHCPPLRPHILDRYSIAGLVPW